MPISAVVAALGHVFGPNEQRGLFRTEDGGAHWTRVLYLDETTGAADIAFSADTPDVLYASLWQLQRHPWLDYFQATVGANSGIYRSDDGGRSWTGGGRRTVCRTGRWGASNSLLRRGVGRSASGRQCRRKG